MLRNDVIIDFQFYDLLYFLVIIYVLRFLTFAKPYLLLGATLVKKIHLTNYDKSSRSSYSWFVLVLEVAPSPYT
ncbi:unnamed protein product [Cyprideis torosa]|uniref:Uncharacterized protein n=1 Tax=Cyprideis torosa TaxID=163714 RepID=A0A7R8WWA2_9CRUS|nr:unnamed protein product [Cyprideis torosa]CAG0907221.1 unnamed protein product [Cyprideis torosa]